MRLKFIFALLLFAVLVLGAGLFLKQHLVPPPASARPASVAPLLPPDTNPVARVAPSPAPLPVAPAPANTPTPEQRQAAIEGEIDRLQQWSMNDDPASLSNILADLGNAEKEIREAAIEATKQFGSSNAIPALKAAANNTDDTREKIAFLEAADFLSLPSISSDKDFPALTPEQIQANQQRNIDRQNRFQSRNQPSTTRPPPEQNSPTAPNQ